MTDKPDDVAALVAAMKSVGLPCDNPTCVICRAADALERLAAENASLVERVKVAEGDAARYRWLRDERAEWVPPKYNGLPYGRWQIDFKSEINELDAAIDRAIAGELAPS